MQPDEQACYAASFSVHSWSQLSFQQYLCPWLAIITVKTISWGQTWGKGFRANKP